MRKIILFNLFLFFGLSFLTAQITVTNTYFPDDKDSLVTANATAPNVTFTRITSASAVAQTWDFGYLRSAQTNTAKNISRFRSVNPVIDTAILRVFPTANLLTADTSSNVQVYRRSATRFDLLGFYSQNLGNIPLSITPVFEPASLERRSPLTFNSTNRNQTGYNVPLATALLPDSIRNLLPIPTDSIRFRFQTTRTDKVDAFGKISIGGLSNVDCLRERRYEISETKVELHILRTTFWLDITTLVFNGNRPPKDTTIEYNFWANQYKEPLVSISSKNDTTATSVRFKWLPLRTNLQNIEEGVLDFKIFPSPTNSVLFLDITGFNQTRKIDIVDVLGRSVLVKVIDAPLSSIDISMLQRGFYLLKLGQKTKPFLIQ
ncbi:MAG: T9SS type A sorting domain-containing protein [Saprospiraceae bacterium]|nr:T9SS type A sorting domain-containing protein [Saprospiraceae bacterium]